MKIIFIYILLPLLFFFTNGSAQVQQIDVPLQQTPCLVSSISLTENAAFKIFFDNTTQQLSFSVSNNNSESNISIHVTSMLGQSVYSSSIFSPEQNFNGSVKLPYIKKGIYYVIIQTSNNTVSKKVIVF